MKKTTGQSTGFEKIISKIQHNQKANEKPTRKTLHMPTIPHGNGTNLDIITAIEKSNEIVPSNHPTEI